MSSDQPANGLPDSDLAKYDRVLKKTQEIADKALDRLRDLSDQLPNGVVEQVERLHQDPVSDRRKATRVGDAAIPVDVQSISLENTAEEFALKDHGPTGIAVILPCPAGVSTQLRVRLPAEMGGGGWVTVEVIYCRKEGTGWIAGCELLGNQPSL